MSYGWNDLLQSAIGAFSAELSVFLLRAGNRIAIDPKTGLIIGLIWLSLLYDPFIKHSKEHKIHFISNLLVTIIICSWLSTVFGLTIKEEIFSFTFFGSGGWLITMLALPLAMLFDRRNLMSIFDRYYSVKNIKK